MNMEMLHDEISLKFRYRGDSEADEFVVTGFRHRGIYDIIHR